ncbi:MAG: hypothetical protein IV094_25810 [Vitreoscilla sp.]|nr:hypothetical protein [Vitreoscilla sp.]
MIFVVEIPEHAEPSAWFAFSVDDLVRKIEARDPRAWGALSETAEPARDLGSAPQDRCRIYWTEAEATAAFERSHDPVWQGRGWRARWALRDQLVATDVLADDL